MPTQHTFHSAITRHTSSTSTFAWAGTYICSHTRHNQACQMTNGWQRSWGRMTKKDGLLRDKCVTWLAMLGCSVTHPSAGIKTLLEVLSEGRKYTNGTKVQGITVKSVPCDPEAHYIQKSKRAAGLMELFHEEMAYCVCNIFYFSSSLQGWKKKKLPSC